MATWVVTDAGWTQLGSAELPSSGVTAGTYGDATHVGQFTVNAQGQVTAAADVAITGGGGTAGLVSLFSSTLGADTASIDTGAGGIAAGHGSLILELVLRTSEAAAFSNTKLTFNADSGANYDTEGIQALDTTLSAQRITGDSGINVTAHGAGGAANYAGAAMILIPAYDATTFYKTGNFNAGQNDTATGNMYTLLRTFTYRSTSAITRATITAPGGSNLKAGSMLTVYGTQ